MNCKKFFAAALLIAIAFVPHIASAAEQDTHTERIARVLILSDSSIAPGKSFTSPEILRRTDALKPSATLSAMVPFQDMWALILKYQRKHASHFSPELIACLFWEESGFRMVEHPISHAAGFGQVLPSTVRAVNKRFGTNFTPNDMLTAREASVEAAVLALELAWEWKHDKAEALAAYAGGAANQRIVHKWLTAESAMLQGRIPYGSSFGMQNYVEYHQIRALRLCSQPGFDPQVLFD